jgi:hypothetical protein
MRLNFGILVSLTLLASAPAYADTEAEARAILDWPEVGLARAESRDKNVYVYFPYEPRDLPEWLEVAMVDFEAPGRVFRARHCCLMEAPDHRISFSSKKGSVYDSWRLQLIWPGPPPENIGWLGPSRAWTPFSAIPAANATNSFGTPITIKMSSSCPPVARNGAVGRKDKPCLIEHPLRTPSAAICFRPWPVWSYW